MLESIMNCKVCHAASFNREVKFHLCDSCSQIIEAQKTEKVMTKTIKSGVFEFKIYKQGKNFQVYVSSSDMFNVILGDSYFDIKDCEEAIRGWVKSPFKMCGGLINVF